ncbi:unnamed protein product [Cuscuta campestris]|uniref:Reverse transcriptase/retrotransposon-derived protein RNase H-like domain-containing protein n=1 Tax=Cuscuta campestris TaxID=132261 RepID=A0A484M3P3_9ASTE|nr:unnamed protein product [Cuscuta campestris]
MQRLIARGPAPRDNGAASSRGPLERKTWRKPTEPVAVATQARNPEKRHIGRECDDLDEDEAQGYPVGFIHGGKIGGDSAAQRKKWKHMAFVAKVQQAPAPKLGRREQIQFTEKDLPNTPSPHRDALVVRIEINNAIVHRTLVDTGSSVNIMYEKTFQDLSLDRKDLRPLRTPLSGFTGDSIEAEGVITVPVIVGDGAHKAKLKMEFMVVSISCAHNMILGRPGLEDLECVISPYYLCMKFPTPSGIRVARGDQNLARPCYVRITKKLPRDETLVVHAQEEMRKLEARPKAKPAEEVEEVLLDPRSKLFAPVLGKSMEAYIDDMIVKSKQATTHAEDLEGVFKIMEKYNLRLNPKKCTFGVQGGKFLGDMVSRRGIEPNPEKVRAILDMEAPRNVKEVQRLTGKLAALSRFLSKVADRTAPFFRAVKKSRGFVWTKECQQSFESLKSYLLSPPVLAKPEAGETLYLYVGVSPKALSSVLVRDKGGAQHPVYYTAKTLRGAELRYSVAEKTVLAVEEGRAQTIPGCSSWTKIKHSCSALLLRRKVERRPYPDVLPGRRSNTRARRSSSGGRSSADHTRMFFPDEGQTLVLGAPLQEEGRARTIPGCFPDEGQTLAFGTPPREEGRAQTIPGCSPRTKVKHSCSALLLRRKVERRPYLDVLPG